MELLSLSSSSNAISVFDNTASTDIVNNDIKNYERGINIINSKDVLIQDNRLDMETQNCTSCYSTRNNKASTAIWVNNAGLNTSYSQTYDVIIDNNDIKHSKIGIQTEFAFAEIINNEILDINDNMSTSGCFPFPCNAIAPFGIRALNEVVHIEYNKVENDPNFYTIDPVVNPTMVGISLENATNVGSYVSSINCNKTKNTDIGLKFNGNSGVTNVYNNHMETHKRGFALDNYADIGDVGNSFAAGNLWSGNFINGSHTYNYSYATGANPTHYILNGSGPLIATSDATANFLPMSTTTTVNGNTVSCSAPQFVRKPNNGQQNTSYTKSSNANRWMRKGLVNDSAFYLSQQLLFHHLSKDSVQFHSKAWKTFVDSMKNTALGKRYHRNTRANIANNNNFDWNLQSLEVILTKHENDSNLSSSDLNQLRQMALKCPYTDGIAVYQARSVLQEYGDPLVVSNCEISRTSKKKKGRKKSIADAAEITEFEIFPNPADDFVNIRYNVQSQVLVRFEIYDVLGKIHLSENLQEGDNHTIQLKKELSGVYFYRLVNEQTILENGKLVIQ